MGVRGLTTYIAENADRYLEPFELHDCNLVIDGDSLSSNLYKSSSQCNSAFGGDYDQYFRHVCHFFEMLKQCNVVPYVLLDGGYQPKKLNTVKHRLRSKIGAIKHLNPFNCPTMFPMMMREVFVEALDHCQVLHMRCLFEADDEVAVLARKLKCPVLSLDSDFFIHNVEYIPSVSLIMKVFRRNVPGEGDGKMRRRKDLISEIDADGNMLKFKAQKVALDSVATKKSFCYYMQCAVYRIEHLARNYRMRKQMLPLFAVLLGNDYISASIFRKFYMNVKVKKIGKNYSSQGKRIVALLRWLQHETLDSAMEKILGHIRKDQKEWIRQQIEFGIAGYKHEQSLAYDYFGFSEAESECEEPAGLESAEEVLRGSEPGDSGNVADLDDSAKEGAGVGGDDDAENDDESDGDDNDEEVEEEDEGDDVEDTEEEDDDEEEDGENQSDENIEEVDELTPATLVHQNRIVEFVPPDWLYAKILAGKLPRFVMDLMTLRLYINAPQVENILLPDCNLISMPILQLIFTMLHHPIQNEFRYLTRIQRRTDIVYQRYSSLNIDIKFDVNSAENFETFKLILGEFENAEDIFASIEESVPLNLRLFFIAIIYWAKNSKHFNVIHACSLLLCQITLTTIDSVIEPIRDLAKLDKLYKTPKCKKTPKTEEMLGNIEHCLNGVTQDECVAAQKNLIELFRLNDKLRKKHTEFTSDILHGFAEFQSIAFHINCLNVMCGERYPNIEMSKCFNGCFLFNAYSNLKDRPNVQYFIEHFMLPTDSMLIGLFRAMFHVLETFIPSLAKVTISKRKKNRNIKKKLLREQRKNEKKDEQGTENEVVQQENQSDSEFEDINNRFACLLKG